MEGKPNLMAPYTDMLLDVRDNGMDEFNKRTGKMCRLLPGYQVRFDISEYFPLLTSRQMFIGGIIGENVGFYRGATSAADFRALGCKFWDANANETAAWLANPNRKGHDDLGRVYGAQWTDWKTHRVVDNIAECNRLKGDGWDVIAVDDLHGGETPTYVLERSINQLANCLETIIKNPSDRRIIYTGWNPGELDLQALPACHTDYRWIPVTANGTLHLVMTIRSWDLYLGAPTNIASGALQLLTMAKLSGYKPGTLTIQAANAHIYENHFKQVDELLTRDHLEPPKMILSDAIHPPTMPNELAEVWKRIEPSHYTLVDYNHLARIDAPMAA